MVHVIVEARNDAGNPGVVKFQGETWELKIWATTDELWKLAGIEKTDWDQRRMLKVGTCSSAPVWWLLGRGLCCVSPVREHAGRVMLGTDGVELVVLVA